MALRAAVLASIVGLGRPTPAASRSLRHHPTSGDGCTAALVRECGPHRHDVFGCAQCAGRTQKQLKAAGCSTDQIAAWCAGLSCPAGQAPCRFDPRKCCGPSPPPAPPSPRVLQGVWSWQGGSAVGGQPSTPSGPGARCCSSQWLLNGTLYIFGGDGHDESGKTGLLDDLWSLAPPYEYGRWKLRAGSLAANRAPADSPAARNYGLAFADVARGQLWLWSGVGSQKPGDATGTYLQDLWRFDTATDRWTNETSRVAGPWPAPREWSQTWTDGAGSLWLFAGTDRDNTTVLNMGTPTDLWHLDATHPTQPLSFTLLHRSPTIAGVYTGPPQALHPGFREGAFTTYLPEDGGQLFLSGGMGVGEKATRADWYYWFNVTNMRDTWSFSLRDGQWRYLGGPKQPCDAKHGPEPCAGTSSVLSGEHAGYAWPSPVRVGGESIVCRMGGEDGYIKETRMRNDLWCYRNGTWRQLSGSQAVNVNGSWGARGAADPGNVPGARYAGQAWTAASSSSGFPTQQLWLFGGFGQDRDGAGKYLSDLWRFDLRWTG